MISEMSMTWVGGTLTHRDEKPATDESSEQLTTSDVDIPRAEGHQIVRCADRVGRNVDTQCHDDQANSGKGSSSSAAVAARVHPMVDDVDGIPQDFAVSRLRGSGSENTK